MEQNSKAARDLDLILESMLFALVRGYQDPVRPKIRTEGMDERDLAFEAGLLNPMEMETSLYGTQKRGRVLGLLREMVKRSWVEMQPMPPQGAFHVYLKEEGAKYAMERGRSVLTVVVRHIRGVVGKLTSMWGP
jgi:hypothetical protein